MWKTDRTHDYGTDDGDQMKAYATPLVINVNGAEQIISPAAKGVIAYDPKNGEVIWSKRVPGKYVASALASGKRIYFFSQEGKATVISAGREYKEVAVNSLDDGFMSSPATIGDDLILRTKTHLYRIGE